MSLPPELLERFPPGADPTTYRLAEVTELLERAAYLPLFSVPRPRDPNKPVFAPPLLPFLPRLPFLITAVQVNEQPRRLRLDTSLSARGLRAGNSVGGPVSTVSIRWTPIPESYEANPDRLPPPTLLNPYCSQRFEMLDGEFRFVDSDGSGFHGFGAGRTFPVIVPGRSHLEIGAVIDILEGFGRLKGQIGTVVVNGTITPPQKLSLNLMVRLVDLEREFTSAGPLPPIQPAGDADPAATFMVFLGEVDPEEPVRLVHTPGGEIVGSDVVERLRLVSLDCDVGQAGLRCRSEVGPLIGTVRARLYFRPLDPNPVTPIQTRHGVFAFHDREGRPVGRVRSNMVEGRAFRTPLEGAPLPIFRFGGFGPILGGEGQFAGAQGMMSMNSAVSVFPRTLSNLYVLRFVDPEGRLRTGLSRMAGVSV